MLHKCMFSDQLQAGIIFFNLVGAFRELEENTIRLFSRTMQVNAPSTIKIDNLIIMHASTDVVKVSQEYVLMNVKDELHVYTRI